MFHEGVIMHIIRRVLCTLLFFALIGMVIAVCVAAMVFRMVQR
jgi:hypothetical protein